MSATPPKPIIATHRARYIRVSPEPSGQSTKASASSEKNLDNTLSLGPGPFVAALEAAAGAQAEVVGKPSRAFFESVVGSLPESAQSSGSNTLGNISSVDDQDGSKIAVIGDDVETDLGDGAIELGLWRVLGEPLLLCRSGFFLMPILW
jgi:hypothetical protein